MLQRKMLPPCKVKVKDVLQCAKHVQRGSSDIVLTILSPNNISGWQHHAPATLHPAKWPSTYTGRSVGGCMGLGWRFPKISSLTGIWSPDHADPSRSLYWINYTGHHCHHVQGKRHIHFPPWRLSQEVPSKHLCLSTKQYGVTSPESSNFCS